MINKPDGATDSSLFYKPERKHRGVNQWDKALIIQADVPLDYHAVKKILPLGMRPSNPPMATLFFADYSTVAYPLFPYHEVAMMVHVRTPVGKGRHCCWIIVDDDTAMILGRELLGYPKKKGIFVFDYNKDKSKINASITRRDVTVISMKAVRGPKETAPEPVFYNKTFHYGGLGQFMYFSPIWLFKPRETIHEAFKADIELKVSSSQHDPVAYLVNGEPRNGRMAVVDIPGTSPYAMPVGFTGPVVFGRTFKMRFR